MGPGLLGWTFNVLCISWTLFVCVIFSLPTVFPVTVQNMNYASLITGGVVIFSGVWYIVSGRFYYKGPIPNTTSVATAREEVPNGSNDNDEKEKIDVVG